MLIGEVASQSGVSARMLRHYDSLGLVRPTGRSPGGYREYSGEDIRRIFHVELLRSLGLSLHDVGRALDDPDFAPADLVDDLVRLTRQRIARDTELLTRLQRVGSADPGDWDEVLRTVTLLQDLGSVSAGTRQRAALSSAGQAADALAEAVLTEPAPNVAGALRWALVQSGTDGLAVLENGLGSDEANVRRSAIESIVEMPGDDVTAVLVRALSSSDEIVCGRAALELGERGVRDAVPTLIEMVAVGTSDVDAADALGVLSSDRDTAQRITEMLGALLVGDATVRCRVAQALAAIPGPAPERLLEQLGADEETAVSLTARYVLGKRRG